MPVSQVVDEEMANLLRKTNTVLERINVAPGVAAIGVTVKTTSSSVSFPYAPSENYVSGATVIASQGIKTLIPAQGAGVRNYITSVSGSNGSGTNVYATFRDGSSGGAVRARFLMAANGGGFTHVMPSPIRNTTNSSFSVVVTMQPLGVGFSEIAVSAQGFKGA